MAPDLVHLPSPLLAFTLIPYVPSNDLLSLRAVSSRFHTLLQNSEESEEIWRQILVRDFHFDDNKQTTEIGVVHHLKSLRISETSELVSPDHRFASHADRVVSVFGYSASEAVFRASSCYESWKHWRKASLRYYEVPEFLLDDEAIAIRNEIGPPGEKTLNGPYFLRAAALWSKIETWCDSPKSRSVGERVKASLTHGMAYAESVIRAKEVDDRGLVACRAIYAFYGGQERAHSTEEIFSGLFGGYSAYGKIACTRFVSSYQDEGYIAVAASNNRMKVFDLHIPTGKIYLRCRGQPLMPAVNPRCGSSDEGKAVANHFDQALVWMEEYASRLESGSLAVGKVWVDEPAIEGILLYPTTLNSGIAGTPRPTPITSRAVTRGVEVVASSILTPEFFHMGMVHVYSIRIRLLTEGEDGYVPPSRRGFETCQLRSRHWQIHDHTAGTTERVDGDGVIGLYPLLREGGYRADYGRNSFELGTAREDAVGTFSYQSCTGPTEGSMEGRLLFVPGSLRDPTGHPFDVEVAPFALDVRPEFLF